MSNSKGRREIEYRFQKFQNFHQDKGPLNAASNDTLMGDLQMKLQLEKLVRSTEVHLSAVVLKIHSSMF